MHCNWVCQSNWNWNPLGGRNCRRCCRASSAYCSALFCSRSAIFKTDLLCEQKTAWSKLEEPLERWHYSIIIIWVISLHRKHRSTARKHKCPLYWRRPLCHCDMAQQVTKLVIFAGPRGISLPDFSLLGVLVAWVRLMPCFNIVQVTTMHRSKLVGTFLSPCPCYNVPVGHTCGFVIILNIYFQCNTVYNGSVIWFLLW